MGSERSWREILSGYPRTRAMAGRVLLLAWSILASLTLAELLLRIGREREPFFHVYDPIVGSRLCPGIEGRYDYEGGALVRINRHGLRGPDYPKIRPEGVFRIAILGDSYTEALQVSDDQAFWSILEDELRLAGWPDGRCKRAANVWS